MLDDRKSAILRAVVQTYIETAQPVGSTHVVDATGIGVSPATVRSDMTLLEREGYLVQPHTSAGRVPTQKGYRFFVDELGPGELGPAQARTVRGFFAHAHGELEEMLQATSRMLSQVTSTAAVVVSQPIESRSVLSVQLVALSTRTYLVLVVLTSGSVLKRTVERDADVDEDALARAGQVVAQHMVGRSITETDGLATSGDPAVDQLAAGAIDAIRSLAADGTGTVHIEGASHIAGAFDAADTLREVLGLLEEQVSVVTLLRDVLDRGLTVAIGSETGVAPLAECSLVVAPYSVAGEPAGTIGVLGPTRMNYQETLAAVAVVSRRLSRLLTEG